MRQKDDQVLLDDLLAFLPRVPDGTEMLARIDGTLRARLLAAMPGLKERAKTLVELAGSIAFIFAPRPLAIAPKAEALLDDRSRALLGTLATRLEHVSHWDAATVEAAIREVADEQGLKLGKVAQPLRAALTGSTISPGIFDVLALLGREETLGRLRDQATSA